MWAELLGFAPVLVLEVHPPFQRVVGDAGEGFCDHACPFLVDPTRRPNAH
jgi:hypothetical protein